MLSQNQATFFAHQKFKEKAHKQKYKFIKTVFMTNHQNKVCVLILILNLDSKPNPKKYISKKEILNLPINYNLKKI